MRAASALASGPNWTDALEQATTAALAELDGATVDLAILFASSVWSRSYESLLSEFQSRTQALQIAGCSGQAIIGRGREVEGEPAISVLLLSLPEGTVQTRWLSQADVAPLELPIDWRRAAGFHEDEVNALLMFADPFKIDCERLIRNLALAYPDRPIVGGLASGSERAPVTHLFTSDGVRDHGAVLVSLGGNVTVKTVVAQGCQPIGEAWTITSVEGHVVREIGGRPAVDVLLETFRTLSPELQLRARGNLMAGIVIDEYRSDLQRGDFLIRNLLGIDQSAGTIAIGADARVGQTIQFQLRDAKAADEDLRHHLEQAKSELGPTVPTAALLCSCNGRGVGLFGVPDHDAAAVADLVAPVPLAGFFCNGEIGPVGSGVYLHGFTASLALIVPTNPATESADV